MLKRFFYDVAKTNKYPFAVRFIILFSSSWIFQGILYMDNTERNFKITLELLFYYIIYFLSDFFNYYTPFYMIFFFSHTLNWVINGQIFVVLKNLNLIVTSLDEFEDYINHLAELPTRTDSIALIALYGSLSREALSGASDLDVRIVRKNGFIPGVQASIIVMYERFRSNVIHFPLDVFLLDDYDGLEKMNERPRILYSDGVFESENKYDSM